MRCKNISIVLDSTRKSKENKTRLRPLYNPYLASRSNEHDGLSRRHRRHAGYTTPPPPPPPDVFSRYLILRPLYTQSKASAVATELTNFLLILELQFGFSVTRGSVLRRWKWRSFEAVLGILNPRARHDHEQCQTIRSKIRYDLTKNLAHWRRIVLTVTTGCWLCLSF